MRMCRFQTEFKHPMDAQLMLFMCDIPSQYFFPNLHSLTGGKLRGKFRRLMLALPSIFPSKTTHRCTKAGKARVNMKGYVL